MSNGSRSSPRRRGEPGLIPRRGAAALLVTAGGLALLLSFRAPESDLFAGSEPLPIMDAPARAALASVGDAPSPAASPTPRVIYGPPAPNATDRTSPTAAPQAASPASPVPSDGPVVAADVTVDGQVLRTPYGDVQVRVTVAAGRITDVVALQLPSGDRHSRRITEIVEPMLREDALSVQSAHIHGVSGATYTSIGYARSLQSALDQAGI